jgi:hypothetical protein
MVPVSRIAKGLSILRIQQVLEPNIEYSPSSANFPIESRFLPMPGTYRIFSTDLFSRVATPSSTIGSTFPVAVVTVEYGARLRSVSKSLFLVT